MAATLGAFLLANQGCSVYLSHSHTPSLLLPDRCIFVEWLCPPLTVWTAISLFLPTSDWSALPMMQTWRGWWWSDHRPFSSFHSNCHRFWLQCLSSSIVILMPLISIHLDLSRISVGHYRACYTAAGLLGWKNNMMIDLALWVAGICAPHQRLPENVTCEFIHP